ncbi:MAG: biopolymer transporter ExbD [Bacteroidia bacterium]|nr:biopolymer transporter ExbD [Bacteroidia bacterium]
MKTLVKIVAIVFFSAAVFACSLPVPQEVNEQRVILPKVNADSAFLNIFEEKDLVVKLENADSLSVKFAKERFKKMTATEFDTRIDTFKKYNPEAHYYIKASPDVSTADQVEVINILAKHKIFKVKLVTEINNSTKN